MTCRRPHKKRHPQCYFNRPRFKWSRRTRCDLQSAGRYPTDRYLRCGPDVYRTYPRWSGQKCGLCSHFYVGRKSSTGIQALVSSSRHPMFGFYYTSRTVWSRSFSTQNGDRYIGTSSRMTSTGSDANYGRCTLGRDESRFRMNGGSSGSGCYSIAKLNRLYKVEARVSELPKVF